jgi:hypothetical protein
LGERTVSAGLHHAGIKDCRDDDIIIISDCDEITNKDAVEKFKSIAPHDCIASLEMDLYYYNEDCKEINKWSEGKILTYKKLKELSPCGARYFKPATKILECRSPSFVLWWR